MYRMRPSNVRMSLWVRVFALTLMVTLVMGGTGVMAGSPTDNLKSLIAEVLTILNNPAYRGPAQRYKAVDLVEKVAERHFDFREMAKSSLGDAWDDLNRTQQDEFVKTFTAVLKNSYSRSLFALAKAKVSYLPEIRLADHVEVPVVIRPPNDKVPLIFRMRKEAGAWRIYDVVVQEVSLVATNQRQFARIIQESSYQNLLKVLKTKIRQAQDVRG
jgi:phospholipid transport system substrate-binding protein